MRKPWQIIVGSAFLGFAIAGVSYAYAALHDYAKPMNAFDFTLVVLSMVLCPPQLLFAACIDCEVIGWGGFIMYSIVGALNAGLYAVIASIVLSLRKSKANRSAQSHNQ